MADPDLLSAQRRYHEYGDVAKYFPVLWSLWEKRGNNQVYVDSLEPSMIEPIALELKVLLQERCSKTPDVTGITDAENPDLAFDWGLAKFVVEIDQQLKLRGQRGDRDATAKLHLLRKMIVSAPGVLELLLYTMRVRTDKMRCTAFLFLQRITFYFFGRSLY